MARGRAHSGVQFEPQMPEAGRAADGEAIIFRHSVVGAKNIEEAAEQNPGYVRIYLNARKEGGRTVLSLSRGSGESLYILSSRDYPDCRAYLLGGIRAGDALASEGGGSSAAPPSQKSRLDDSSGSSIKKTRQQSLLDFLNKK